jgi:hypothetical protein
MLDKRYTVLAYSIPSPEELAQKLKDAGLNPDGRLQVGSLADGLSFNQAEEKLQEVLEPYIGKKPKWEDGYMGGIDYSAREAHVKFMTFFVSKWKGKVKEIEIGFSGSGDDGDMEVENIYDADGKEVDAEMKTEFLEDFAKWGEAFVNDCVIEFDWYNNEGGQGFVNINLDTGECTMNGSQNVPQDLESSINFNDSGGKVAAPSDCERLVNALEEAEKPVDDEFPNRLKDM